MDFWKALAELQAERKRLSTLIEYLETLSRSGPERRGRRDMPPAERQIVSERMKVYWDGRRQTKRSSQNGNQQSPAH